MYAAPPEIETRLFTRLLDEFRIAGEPNFWVGINKPGGMMDSFLEGRSFDRDGNLYCVDIPYGRIFRVSPDGLALDAEGNLAVAHARAVTRDFYQQYRPKGNLWSG